MKRLASIGSALVFIVVLTGCGGHTPSYQEGGNPSVNEVPEPAPDIVVGSINPTSSPTADVSSAVVSSPGTPERNDVGTLTPWHNLLNSPHYSGYLAVMFREGSGVRLREGKWTIISPPRLVEMINNAPGRLGPWAPAIASLNDAVSRHGGLIHRGMDIEEETIEAALIKANKEGKKLHDWNLYYTIEVENPDAAEALWTEFAKSSIVMWTHPIPKLYPLGGLGPTPDLIGKQGYLDSEQATGGLNIYPAWNKGISGQGIIFADMETNWNFDHEDLPIDRADVSEDFWTYDPNRGGNSAIQHGTAVVGILGGLDNGSGVKGIAHSGEIELMQGLLFGTLIELLEGYVGKKTEKFKPGDIVVIEVGIDTEKNPGSTCVVNSTTREPTYCGPVEFLPSTFAATEDTTTLGGVVVEGAANGGVDLGDPSLQFTNCGQNPCPDLAVDDSGAIMVAASMGGKDNTKPWWSNWGKRINAYAWGYGITTTGYGVDFDVNWQAYPNTDSDPNDPNRWYTNGFGGTSGATALVAGAVALVQSYTREYYRHTSQYNPMLNDIVPHKQVYLDAWQMRRLIELAGVSCDPNYNIGYKPDVGKMFELIEQGVVIPHVAPDNAALVPPKYAVAGVRYDMDGDKRAELISWTPSSVSGAKDGLWKIDLSTIAPNIANPGPDNYGDWDLKIEFQMDDAIDSGIFFPVVHDYDSDGDADLAIYDSKNGKWYIRYITPEIVARHGNGTLRLDWDAILDYSTDPMWKSHARPLPGDYDGDNFLDIAIVRADGHWAIDYGGIGYLAKNGGSVIEYKTDFRGFEQDVVFLTPQQLAEAPGWGYMSGAAYSTYGPNPTTAQLLYRVPDGLQDGLQDSGKLGIVGFPNFNNTMMNLQPVFGENDSFIVDMTTTIYGFFSDFLGIKEDNGIWKIANNEWDTLTLGGIYNGYGDASCPPAYADYSGEGHPDRVVKCGSTWKIAITDPNVTDFRMVQLNDDSMSLPPTIYPGGIKYQDMKAILNFYNLSNAYQDKDPFTPYTVNCIKYWGVPPEYCLAPQ